MHAILLCLIFFSATTITEGETTTAIPKTVQLCTPKVEGHWTNELGSEMVITRLHGDKNFYGRYCTAVSRAPIKSINKLVGNVGQTTCVGISTPLGFTVTYYRKDKTALSTATWSGQYINNNGDERIYTTWLLTTPAKNIKDLWASTMIGKDTFKRGKGGPGVKC